MHAEQVLRVEEFSVEEHHLAVAQMPRPLLTDEGVVVDGWIHLRHARKLARISAFETGSAGARATGTVDAAVSAPDGGTTVMKTFSVQWQVDNVLDGGGNPRPCLRDIELRVTWPEANLPNGKSLSFATRRYNWGGASC